MRISLCLAFFCLFPSFLQAQLLYPEWMEIYEQPMAPVYERGSHELPFPAYLTGKRLPNRSIENPAIRYTVQNLKKEHYVTDSVNQALSTLINYAQDERLKFVVSYLKKYTRDMASREQALEVLQQQVSQDSLAFYSGQPVADSVEGTETYSGDLQAFVQYINTDSNYVWLRKISRDSVLLEVISMSGTTSRFWINTGKNHFHRFWASNKMGDTIGTWIQALPQGNRIRLYVDEDVYQAPRIQTKEVREEASVIQNQPGGEYFQIVSPVVGTLRRRYWTYYSEVEIAMSQGALVNWSSGGENSLSLLSNIRYFWNYNRNKTSWENWVHYRFGFMKNGNEDMRKNEDRFELNSKLGQKAFKHWYYTAQFNVLTQLFNSYDYPKDKSRELVANFMSPGYFTLSVGLDYKPNDNFSLFLSPIAGKWNFVRDTAKIDASRYGVEDGKRYKRNAGARLDLRSKVSNLFKIMDIRNELTMFYSYDEKDTKKDSGEKILPFTANWKLTLDFKINYFMRASLYTETIYDQNYSDKLQFKENLNLGINFRF